ncbi:diaminohydroxyphosphoribosylaminopyrimidine deaminase / 5-amino-6-(5-phosphoribosylamino)uracil reductase [Pedobacter steynii]|uniref:Riboflavin biosynthesis protein RibD n=1 Tax=Pedobacter steynii TaxID=430522 RepID=A0A1H0CF57_9SPHI|nr:bifunctional diaminohydroxyphosphoribosylaminopyrimidine deaminase/5-amino-6-(5-phosphoribosylamino)uracil reductase RibD [Pedobacter steynii]NQX41550.1 bifunctional diaminohydroxyphosphoribosylaminopyrimidine deaminase/5-amino-6-(5-phosphoribosylamino)uracil reductase RibD [Pedobacter steynii]SDN56482.1 diaminohydroxyphosphoribosylaminopyrimidine deaminase / 5-amino-6-(5-phosphoribosylamino)uracil reductase [Pedobacter steynii]
MTDELYMQRCLELASLGMGNVSPNPMVGCVIVSEGKIIGEGYHEKIGEAHAEVNAVKAVFDKYGAESAALLLKNATAYVSLEPCAHFGKTPPCADLLIRHQLKRVVIGNRDPFEAVDGKGIEKLKNAGIEVSSGILEKESSWLNRRFFTRILQKRPYIILKWARTANGFFAPVGDEQRWISRPLAKRLVHKWRTEEDAVLVGKRTALVDNPQLNAREWPGRNPIRLLIDRNLEIPSEHYLYNNEAKTIIFNEIKTDVVDNIHFVQMEDMQYYLPQKIAFQLYLMDIQSVIIDGGAQLLNQFITAGLWDEARVFTSAVSWADGMLSPQINGMITEVQQIGKDQLSIYQNKR